MKTITKEEVDSVMGKTSFWFPDAKKQLVGSMTYVGGIGAFDALNAMSPLNLKAKPNGLLIEKMKGVSFVYVALLNQEIKEWSIETREQIYEQKEKSVVGRALVGGLLLGPVGAIVGGMSGIGSKTVKTSTGPENILTITHSEGVSLFDVPTKNITEVRQFFENNYRNLNIE